MLWTARSVERRFVARISAQLIDAASQITAFGRDSTIDRPLSVIVRRCRKSSQFQWQRVELQAGGGYRRGERRSETYEAVPAVIPNACRNQQTACKSGLHAATQ